jgi:hypothetical protein
MHRILLAAALLAPAPALAAPCTPAALTGTWSLVSIRSANPQIEEFYRRVPNEVIRFGARGDVIYVASNQPYTAERARRALDQADAADGVTYAFQLDGERLMLLRDGQPFEGFLCQIADASEGAVRPGDMILTNLPERAALQRIQRRLR